MGIMAWFHPSCPNTYATRQLLFELQMHSRRSALEVHDYDGNFLGRAAHFRMTSVIGHVLSIDFPAKFQNWDTTDPSTLFDAPTLKNESNPKVLPDPSPSDWHQGLSKLPNPSVN